MYDQQMSTPKISELRRAATQSVVAQNELLGKDLVAYYLAWQSVLGEQRTVIYNGMGPDFASPLLLYDPDVIHGIDPMLPAHDSLVDCLENWDSAEEIAIRSLADTLIVTDTSTVIAGDAARALFEDDLHYRNFQGYWRFRGGGTDWTGYMVVDLKGLGVEEGEVQIHMEGDTTVLEFPWGYPGKDPKVRTVYLHRGTYEHFPIEEPNVLYQKALGDHEENAIGFVLQFLDELQERGIVAVGNTTNMRSTSVSEVKRLLRNDFARLHLANDLTSRLRRKGGKLMDQPGYGWYVHMFRRKG